MGKRTKKVIITKHSIALKELRIKSSLSLGQLADRMGFSKSFIHQIESGRAEIYESYINKFFEVTGYNIEVLNEINEPSEEYIKTRERCIELITQLNKTKLNKVLDFLIFINGYLR